MVLSWYISCCGAPIEIYVRKGWLTSQLCVKNGKLDPAGAVVALAATVVVHKPTRLGYRAWRVDGRGVKYVYPSLAAP